MKTLNQLVQEHIARSGALVGDPIRMSYESDRVIRRLASRIHEDPALYVFTTHFAQALAATLRVVPEGLHAAVIQSLLGQVVMEWEDVNNEFSSQFQPQTPNSVL